MEIIFLYGAYGEEHFLCIEFLSFKWIHFWVETKLYVWDFFMISCGMFQSWSLILRKDISDLGSIPRYSFYEKKSPSDGWFFEDFFLLLFFLT